MDKTFLSLTFSILHLVSHTVISWHGSKLPSVMQFMMITVIVILSNHLKRDEGFYVSLKSEKDKKFYLRTKRYPNTISPDRIAEIQIFEWGCSKLRTIHFNLKPIYHCCSSWTLIIFILSISMPYPTHYILVFNNFKVVSFPFDWWTCNISVVFEPILMMKQTCQ